MFLTDTGRGVKSMDHRKDDLIARVIMAFAGMFCGFFIITHMDVSKAMEAGPSGLFLTFATVILAIAISVFIQSIVHELGHLVFGLLSGYSFTSFRIGHFMIVKDHGMLKVKIYNLVGTSGQCLMRPPLWREDLPYRLYNFGGCIMNASVSLIITFCLRFMDSSSTVYKALVIIAAIGYMLAIVNGVPLRPGGIANDGYNAFILGNNRNALRSFWLQLYVNGLISDGERMHNLPEDWFFLPEGEDLNNPIICTIGVFRYNYYFDAHDFEKAEETAEYMLKAPGLLDIHRNELLCELLFCRVMRGAEPEEIKSLLTPSLNRYIKATSSYVSRKRLAFTYFYLFKKQYDIALKCMQEFDRVCNTYPYSSEIENEKEVMEIVKEKGDDS